MASYELKYQDVAFTFSPVLITGNDATLCLLNQGPNERRRVGQKFTIWSLQLRFDYFLPELSNIPAPIQGDGMRIIVFVDKQCNGAKNTTLDLLEEEDLLSPYNLHNVNRFVILSDVTHTINYLTLTSESLGNVTQGSVCKFGQSVWDDLAVSVMAGETGSVAELSSNRLAVLAISSAAKVRVNMWFRFRYTDH